jgi:D-alanyl-lipoteichoic acid acyltransferase DltB (MBOAT superfamily)
MLFNSWQFLIFALIFFSLYYVLPLRRQNWLLLVGSYLFYAAWDWRFVALLAGSTVIDFFMARAIDRAHDPRARRTALLVSLTFNLGVLGLFKYFNFFAESAVQMLHMLGMKADPVTLTVVLPIGISFYTFMTISYVVDVYRRELRASDDLLEFAVFVCYFPHLVAGPILRAAHLLPQISSPRHVTTAQIHQGLWLISWGLFKKVVIADNLTIIVDRTFDATSSAGAAEYLVAIYAFAFQIYCDFSGYSDMARGLANLMGFDLKFNFLRPYWALGMRDFWRRWHISLSTWLRDYLYIPLGGSRHGRWPMYRALMLTMALGGLWHGANWTFVVWGIYHGSLLVGERWLASDLGLKWPSGRLANLVGIVVTFHLVCLGWLLFRATSLSQVAHVLATIAQPVALGAMALKGLALLAPLALLLHVFDAPHWELEPREPAALWRRAAVVGGLWAAALLMSPSLGKAFIYFQF